MIKLQAHRGVSTAYPENTLAAFRAAVEEGYGIIECDLKYTADGEIVVLHDRTVNRTARRKDGTPLPEPTPIDSLQLREARALEYGSWFSKSFRGEPIPTLAELMTFATKTRIPLKLDNCWEGFPPEMREKLFSELEKYADRAVIGFTCAHPENLRVVAERFPACMLHYDGGDLSEERLSAVADMARGHSLTIWNCFDNELTGWFRGTKASPDICARIKRYGDLGVWILHRYEELATACAWGADVVETTGSLKPAQISEINR